MSQLGIFYEEIVEFSGIQYCNIDIIDSLKIEKAFGCMRQQA